MQTILDDSIAPVKGERTADVRAEDGAARPRKTTGYGKMFHLIGSDPRLTAADIRVYTALTSFAFKRDRCYPADDSIAGYARIAKSSVNGILRRLEGTGYIRREYPGWAVKNGTGRVIVLCLVEAELAGDGKPTTHAPQRGGASSPAGGNQSRDGGPHAPQRAKEDRYRYKGSNNPGNKVPDGEEAPRTTTIPPETPDPESTPEVSAEQPRTTTTEGAEVQSSEGGWEPIDDPQPEPPGGTATREEPPPDLIDTGTPDERQGAFLGMLDDEKRARLDAMSKRVRDGILGRASLAADDAARRHLIADSFPPQRPRSPTPDARHDLPSLVDALEAGNPNAPQAIAQHLHWGWSDTDKHDSYKAYLKACMDVLEGRIGIDAFREVLCQATGGTGAKVDNPGALFIKLIGRERAKSDPRVREFTNAV